MGRIGGNFWLYLKIMTLNVATLFIFFAIGQKPLQAKDFGPINYSRPIILQSHEPLVSVASGIPKRLVIQSLGLDLSVGIGSYEPISRSWSISADRAYYADISAPVNNIAGTTLIYGHAQRPVFGELHDIQSNDKAVVYSDTGYVFQYLYQSVRQVDPADVDVFSQNGSPVLVLQTCAGPWDAYRALFTFKFESVEKI